MYYTLPERKLWKNNIAMSQGLLPQLQNSYNI